MKKRRLASFRVVLNKGATLNRPEVRDVRLFKFLRAVLYSGAILVGTSVGSNAEGVQ